MKPHHEATSDQLHKVHAVFSLSALCASRSNQVLSVEILIRRRSDEIRALMVLLNMHLANKLDDAADCSDGDDDDHTADGVSAIS